MQPTEFEKCCSNGVGCMHAVPTELENAVPTELERCNQRSWKDATNGVGKMQQTPLETIFDAWPFQLCWKGKKG
jgi:hypothetical protein